MQTIPLGSSSLQVSRLAFGCWRIAGSWEPAEITAETRAVGRRAIHAALEAGYTLFDHADIYSMGISEEIFGEALRESAELRTHAIIATKCGIRFRDDPFPGAPYRYDSSRQHIIASCEGSLRRLGLERIDLFQIHRPDFLAHPEEIASAFATLQEAGKVREFGVSNFRPSQLAVLQKTCPMPLVVNQVEFSLLQRNPLSDGTLDQCVIDRITPMAWSPLGGGLLAEGARKLLRSQEVYRPERANMALDQIAQRHGVMRSLVALAWLLLHPAGVIPIVGSVDVQRIQNATKAVDLPITREEWYTLLTEAESDPLP